MNEINLTVEGGTSKRLLTAGKYCDRDIVVTATGEGSGGIDTSDATAEAKDFIQGKTAYVKGKKVTGTTQFINSDATANGLGPVWVEDTGSLRVYTRQGARYMVEEDVALNLDIDGYKLGDAEDDDVTEGKTYTSASGLKRTGTKAAPVEVAQAVPKIGVNYQLGEFTAISTQAEGYVLAGTKTASHQLPILETNSYTPTTYNQIIDKYQWLTGNQTIKGDANLIPENIKSGVSIFGVVGTLVGGGLPDGVTALASGTVTIAQTSTYENITHNLGVKPNFIAWMMEDAATVTGLTSTAVCGVSFDTGATSSNIRYMVDGYNSSDNNGGTAARATNNTYMTTTTARMYAHNSYKLVAGKTYRWICGVMKVV